jgi:hypothetical protein
VAVLALGACGLGAGAAGAAPAPLHLGAVIPFKQVNANGSFEAREMIYESGRRAGEGSIRCSRPVSGRRRCSGSVTLEAGQVDFAGTIANGASTYRLGLTGGGGRWSRARGTIVSVFSDGATRAAVTISFS